MIIAQPLSPPVISLSFPHSPLSLRLFVSLSHVRAPLWRCCVGAVRVADRHPGPQWEAILVQHAAIVGSNRMDWEVKRIYWFSLPREGGRESTGENKRRLTADWDGETWTWCLWAACLFVRVVALGRFDLLAGSDVVDGQMAGGEGNVWIMKEWELISSRCLSWSKIPDIEHGWERKWV